MKSSQLLGAIALISVISCGKDLVGLGGFAASTGPTSTSTPAESSTGGTTQAADDRGTTITTRGADVSDGGSTTSGDSDDDRACADGDDDRDGVCNVDDICAQGDDTVDTDGDGTPDACDLCSGDDPDGDGHCSPDECASVEFSGNDGWLASPANPFGNVQVQDGTVSLWFQSTCADRTIFSGEGDIGLALFDGRVFGCTDGVCTFAAGKTVANDGRWHHLALTWDDSLTALYVDGQLDATAIPAHGPNLDGNNQSFVLGQHAALNEPTFDGLIAEVAMWNEVLSDEAILALSEGDRPDAPQLLWWPLSAGLGANAEDLGPNGVTGSFTNGALWSQTCPWADSDGDGVPAFRDPDDSDPDAS